MIEILKQNKFFYIAYTILFLFGMIGWSLLEKGTATIFINGHYSTALDFFFKYYTHLATSGVVIGLGVILYLFKKKNIALFLFCSLLSNSLVIQFLKRIVIPNNDRPFLYFYHEIMAGQLKIHHIDGVQIHKVYAMPSGHTNTAFIMALCFALFSQKKQTSVLFLIPALLIGLSRMYLFQHFMADTLMGSLIAMLLTSVIYYLLTRYNPNFNPNKL